MTEPKLVPLSSYCEHSGEEIKGRAAAFYEDMRRRRSVRHFAPRPVPREAIEDCLRAAATAPSGANMQPWHFCIVSDPAVKRRIRKAAEEQERAFYSGRGPQEWLNALSPLGTSADKPFLETAPYLIVVFAQRYGLSADGERIKHYYVSRSVGIATGILVAAIHRAGLVSLTYTPSAMGFLSELLGRPANERPFLIVVVGHPASDAQVPDIAKKSLSEIATFI